MVHKHEVLVHQKQFLTFPTGASEEDGESKLSLVFRTKRMYALHTGMLRAYGGCLGFKKR